MVNETANLAAKNAHKLNHSKGKDIKEKKKKAMRKTVKQNSYHKKLPPQRQHSTDNGLHQKTKNYMFALQKYCKNTQD